MDRLALLKTPANHRDRRYWSFDGRAEREFSHAFLQYPAMMVPQMQGEIIDRIRTEVSNTKHVWDPFVGAGTSLGETMLRGLDFSGNDINPLAVLVSKTKRGPLHVRSMKEKTILLYERIRADTSENIDVDFLGLDKWFTTDAAIILARIRRAIRSEHALWARRFFWVALAESIRLTSNSRTSTYKLHIRPSSGNGQSRKNPLHVFVATLDKNLVHLSDFKEKLRANGHISNGVYRGSTQIALQDTTSLNKNFINNKNVDLLITSPPYGDNRTTVAYGQYSYLPLNWIDMTDIDKDASTKFIQNTNTIDAMSLGGSNNSTREKAAELSDHLQSFRKIYDQIGTSSPDAQKKVTSYFYDLNKCIDPIFSRLRKDGVMVWTLGNRSVTNIRIPLDKILQEMLTNRGAQLIAKIERQIPSKRMPSKNNISDTMNIETVIVLKNNN